MAHQDYKHHIRWYIPHHFVFYPLVTGLLSSAVYFLISMDQKLVWFFIVALIALVTWVAYMLRQHYALTLQNRIVHLELAFRYYVLTQQRLELLPLSNGQLFALRFASDAELPNLVQRTLSEKLSPNAIKKSIENWKADNVRV